LSCVQAVMHYLDLIHNNSHLNAFTEVFAEEAIQQAEALDASRGAGEPMGRLHGVVVGIKDVICYAGHRVTAGSGMLRNFTAVYSATVVERLLAEGAIVIGSLNCDEFAMGSTNENSVHGPVRNAFDNSRVSGGSSGGSAVGVQAGLCMVSLGSDTGGSVRLPASYCGVVGFKPSYGRVSRHGLIAYASSFDQVGIFAKSIPDVARVLEVIAGHDEFDSTVSRLPVPEYNNGGASKKFRFACFADALSHPALDSEIRKAIENTLGQLREQGHAVQLVSFSLLDYIVPAYYVLTTAEASSNLARYDGVRFGYRSPARVSELSEWYKHTRSEGFGQEVKRRILLGTFVLSTGFYDAYFTRAQRVRTLVAQQMNEIWNEFDFVLMPTATSTAPLLGDKNEDPVTTYLSDIFTVVANLTGIPAVSLPLYRHSNDMPFGLQIMARQFNELSLLRVSELMFKPSSVP